MSATSNIESLTELYEVIHDYEDNDGYDIYTYIGVFSNKKKAMSAVKSLKNTVYFSLHPNGFMIQKVRINARFWIEGFDKYWFK